MSALTKSLKAVQRNIESTRGELNRIAKDFTQTLNALCDVERQIKHMEAAHIAVPIGTLDSVLYVPVGDWAKSPAYRLRQAIARAGINYAQDYTIFQDKRKDGTRRMKVWQGAVIKEAPKEKQWKLHDLLVEAFGSQLVTMYLIEAYRVDWSFCVVIKNEQ
jgi:hypothetical protein